MPDFQKALGALMPQGTIPMTIFIPSLDRDGRAVDQQHWVENS